MKIFIAGIIVFLIAAAYISKNECFSSHSKSNKQINYEKATKVIYAELLKSNGIQPTISKVNELAQNHLYIHNAVEELMFRENEAEELYDNIMGEMAEWEENYGMRSLAPGN